MSDANCYICCQCYRFYGISSEPKCPGHVDHGCNHPPCQQCGAALLRPGVFHIAKRIGPPNLTRTEAR